MAGGTGYGMLAVRGAGGTGCWWYPVRRYRVLAGSRTSALCLVQPCVHPYLSVGPDAGMVVLTCVQDHHLKGSDQLRGPQTAGVICVGLV